MTDTTHAALPWMRQKSLRTDDLTTQTSEDAGETAEACLPALLAVGDELPVLDREKHVRFAEKMIGKLPSGMASLDASRPWLCYWSLNALALMGKDLSVYRESLLATLKPLQSPIGGFAGGPGQAPHLANTYAALLALALVGGNALELVNRDAIWHWLGYLKRSDGGFDVAVGGESDTRGAYTAMTAITLLDLPRDLPEDSSARENGHTTFMSGLGDYIGNCQTFEGGIGSCPDAEAHGSYTFCGLACLALLGDLKETLNEYLDVQTLITWLCARQVEQLGGLAGRTNKLVDGCYSHWIGGCYTLVKAAIRDEIDHAIENPEALAAYILCCAQHPQGGLRDKPGMRADAYHTCYNLAGLSSTEHNYKLESLPSSVQDPKRAATAWHLLTVTPQSERSTNSMHPVFVVPYDTAQKALHV